MISHSSPAIFFLWMKKLTSDCNILFISQATVSQGRRPERTQLWALVPSLSGASFPSAGCKPATDSVSHPYPLLPKIIRIVLHHIIFPHELFDFLPVTQVFMMCLLPGDISRHLVYF